jgi:MOSC domain-containing protein YiiM
MSAIRVLAVCTGSVGPLIVRGNGPPQTVISGIAKSARSTPEAPVRVRVGPLGLEGDEQADRTVHGGLDKAVYVYPHQHYAFWRTVRMQAGIETPLAPGALGENLVIEGLAETGVWVGDRLSVGEVELRIESPRQPCFKFNGRMGFDWAVKMMIQSGFTGFYCSVLRAGTIAANDSAQLRPGAREISILQSHQLRNRPRR